MKNLEENYDIVVVGAGHAGCEAAPGRGETGIEYDHVYGKRREYCADAL